MTPFPRTMQVAAVATALGAAWLSARPLPAQQHTHGHVAPVAGDTARWTQADVAFMSGMIGHHAQAITMARLAPTHGASPGVLRLSERIINAQVDEIVTMQTWLRDRGQPVPEVEGHHAGHHAMMPGMLTEEQMARLTSATGSEFDRLFLTGMIQHHRGAVSMVTELFSHNGAGQDETVFKFASDVNVDQTTEINRMQRMLADLILGSATP